MHTELVRARLFKACLDMFWLQSAIDLFMKCLHISIIL